MSWLGKAIGGGIGFMVGGPIGAVAGAALGHGLDEDDTDTIEDTIGEIHVICPYCEEDLVVPGVPLIFKVELFGLRHLPYKK